MFCPTLSVDEIEDMIHAGKVIMLGVPLKVIE
jgi:hypothetical protein